MVISSNIIMYIFVKTPHLTELDFSTFIFLITLCYGLVRGFLPRDDLVVKG